MVGFAASTCLDWQLVSQRRMISRFELFGRLSPTGAVKSSEPTRDQPAYGDVPPAFSQLGDVSSAEKSLD